MTTSIILPTFNEAGHIADLIRALCEQVHDVCEILVIDDASPDGTADAVEAIKEPLVRVIRRSERGLISALQTGIAASRGDIILWMDADFSHPPEVAEQLRGLVLSKPCDVAVASRFVKNHPGRRNTEKGYKRWVQCAGSRLANKMLQHLLSKQCTDWTSGFVAIRAERIKPLQLQGFYGDYFIRMIGELIAAEAVIDEVSYQSPPRRSGHSKTATSWIRLARLAAHYGQTIRQTQRLLK